MQIKTSTPRMPSIKNDNLFIALVSLPCTVMFYFLIVVAMNGGAPLYFVIAICLAAAYFLMNALAHLAWYTNDYVEENIHPVSLDK